MTTENVPELKTKAEARKLLKSVDYLQLLRLAERLGIRWGSMRLPKGLLPPMGSLCRKLLRAHCKNVFPTSDIKILSRGVRVDFPGSMNIIVKMLYIQRLYQNEDVNRRKELARIPEISARLNSGQVLVRSSSGLIELDCYGSYVLFRCYETDFDRFAAYTPNSGSSKSAVNLLMDRIQLTNNFKAMLSEFATLMQDAERRIAEIKKAEEERLIRENAEAIESAKRVAEMMVGLANLESARAAMAATEWMDQAFTSSSTTNR